jgi:hypothetical protein
LENRLHENSSRESRILGAKSEKTCLTFLSFLSSSSWPCKKLEGNG